MVLSGNKKSKLYRDVRSIKILYLLANILAISPVFDFEKCESVPSIYFNCYAFIMLFAAMGAGVWSLFGRVHYDYAQMTNTVIATDAAMAVLLIITIFTATIRLCIWKNHNFKKFLAHLKRLDNELGIPRSRKKGRRKFYLEIIGYSCFVNIVCMWNNYVWIHTLSLRECKNYLFQYFQYYYVPTLSYFIYNFAIILRDRFAYINNMLTASLKASNQIFVMTVANSKNDHVRQVARLYMSVCDLVELFNAIFGFIILLLTANIILGLLVSINFALVYTKSDYIGIDFGADLASVAFLLASMFMTCGVMIAAACDEATKEAKKTSSLSYKLIQSVSLCKWKHLLREDLILLAQQSHHAPLFTAAGFFTLDYTMLLGILGSVSTYLIVLIQLN